MNPHADNVITMITTTTKITEQEIAMASTSPLLRELVAEIHKYKYEHKQDAHLPKYTWESELNMISCITFERCTMVRVSSGLFIVLYRY